MDDNERPQRQLHLSIRGQITLVAGLLVAVVLVTIAVLLVRLEMSAVGRSIDLILLDEAEAIASEVASGRPAPIPFDPDRILVVLDADQTVIASAGPHEQLLNLDVAVDAESGSERTLLGEPHRVVVHPYEAPDGRVGTVRIAEPLDEEFSEGLRVLVRALLWILPLTIVALMALVWYVVGHALRPVDQMRAEVDQIAFEQLDRRVDVPKRDDEISRLARTMNLMLDRMAIAARRQQRFVADASHELRTPLARMRAELEADRAAPRSGDVEVTRASQLEEIGELQQMVEDLLVLARDDASHIRTTFTAVDLDDLVFQEAAAARTPRVVVDTRQVSGAQAFGARNDLRRIVRNLIDNAVRHAESTVMVTLTETADGVELHVDDDGSGVPPERRDDVFERFTRLEDRGDGPQSRQTGLGLAIVRDLVARHDGTVCVDDAPIGGARFTVTLPCRE